MYMQLLDRAGFSASFLPRFMGLYCLQFPKERVPHYLVVFENLFPPGLKFEAKYDLKGVLGSHRYVSAAQRASGVEVLKERKLVVQLEKDVDFLEKHGRIDYSLLSGRHGLGVGPTCPVCNEVSLVLLRASRADPHAACERCWMRWAEEQLEECFAEKKLPRCLWPQCQVPMAGEVDHLAKDCVWELVQQSSAGLQELLGKLKRRKRLQNNPLFPAALQVECPRCVGIGYLGFDTVMCFLCEYQWEDSGEKPLELSAGECPPEELQLAGVRVQRCPKLGVARASQVKGQALESGIQTLAADGTPGEEVLYMGIIDILQDTSRTGLFDCAPFWSHKAPRMVLAHCVSFFFSDVRPIFQNISPACFSSLDTITLEEYSNTKAMESTLKSLKYSLKKNFRKQSTLSDLSTAVSSMPPPDYAKRFLNFMHQIFSLASSFPEDLFSNISLSNDCLDGHCEVPAGHTWILDQSVDPRTLKVFGTVKWDTEKDRGSPPNCPDPTLATTSRGQSPERRIVDISPATVWRLDLHNATAGVEREAASNTIDGLLNTEWSSWCAPYCTGAGDEHWLEVQLAALSEVSHVKLYWHAERYAPVSQVEVCEDRCRGVLATVGDLDLRSFKHSEPQVVKLGFQGTHIRVSASFEELKVRATPHWAGLLLYEIRAYGKEVNVTAPVVLHLDNGLSNEHWGGFREVEGYSLEMAAEVNLNRSVVITGDHDDFKLSRKGLHTISAHGGVMDVRYTRIEYCGQQNHMGKYCLHFHHAGQCADCVFMGNTIYESAQVGITVHGTHRSLVENNILWDTAAAGIYIEDGNEMFNTLSNNVIICTWHAKCTTPWDVQLGNVAGIYMIGMTNNVIENRVAGFENCIWTIGSIALQGQGQALGRVCPQHTPFGTFRGNVCHDNNRFGTRFDLFVAIYLDNQMPRNLERDSNGFVVDMGSCGEFTQDGRDNGLSPANVIEDQFDWHNDFVGQYSMGDDDTVLKVALIAGPAGPFTFRITNTTFGGGHLGCGAICAGQHCGLGGAGGPCNVQYLLSGVDFSKVHPGDKKIVFGISTVDLGYVQPIFLAEDDSLGGYRSMVSKHLNGFAKLPGCQVMGEEWDEAVACGGHVRRLNLWSANLGDLNMYGPGYDVEPTLTPVVKGMNAGKLLFEPMHGVFERTCRPGDFRGDISTELSDVILAKTFDLEETLHLTIGNETCKVSVQDDRSWLGVRGPAPWTSPRVSCLTRAFEANYLTNGGTTTSQPTTTTVTGTSGSCALESEVPCCPDGSCADRCTGSQCCPSSSGTVTCPSSSSVQISTCDAGKRFDCTGNTGVAPPGRLEGNCEFPNPPAIAYYWEPFCFLGKKGCFADGVNDVTCITTTTTTTTTSGACSVLTGVQKSCSEDGCTVLTEPTRRGGQRRGKAGTGSPPRQDFNISGAAVNLHPCGPESVPSEQWIHHPSTGQLTNANELTRCLHAAEQDVPGALLVMLPCSAGSPAQNFTLDDATRQIRISSGLCLEWLPGGEWMTVVTAVYPVATTTTVVPGWTETAWGPPSASVTGLLQHSGGLCAHQTNQSLTMAVCEPGSSQWFTYNESLRQISAGGLCLASSISSSGGIALGSCNESLVTQFAFNLQSGMIWNRQMQCLEAAVPLVEGASAGHALALSRMGFRPCTGSLVHLRDCNRSQEGQRWLFNSAATTTQAPVSVGLHIKLDSGLCLASKENSSRSCLELRGCQEADQAQKWFYDETSNQLKNGWDRCLAAPHAGGILQIAVAPKAKIAFAPVRGGIGRACRGSSWRDNDRSNYIAFWPVDLLEVCKERCRERASCTGIEFNAWLRRCEVWIKPVTTSVKASNFTCYNASLEDPTLAIFEDVDGGADRVCRGKHSGDNSASYYTASLAESKEESPDTILLPCRCTGFEYHQFGRCELWSAPVGSSREASGYYCRALATVITQDCNVSDVRQSWRLDSARKILSVQERVANST
eukprot:g17517.t3